jgi:hypothetical protein
MSLSGVSATFQPKEYRIGQLTVGCYRETLSDAKFVDFDDDFTNHADSFSRSQAEGPFVAR